MRMIILLAALVAPALASAQSFPRESLRIATFNAYLLSAPFRCLNATLVDCIAQNDGLSAAWAEDLADRILADTDSLDVIVVNEVWDEDARNVLRRRLAAAYPIQVRRIAKQLVELDLSGVAGPIRPRIFGEDSGLMLFAKSDLRVLPLPNPANRWQGDTDTRLQDALDSTTPEVAYAHYRNCAIEDCLASKGVALIRLQHRLGGTIYNIAFTHMQADPDDAPERHRDVRGAQFREIQAFLVRNFPDISTRMLSGAESFLLLGDLNVPYLKARNEWNSLYANLPNQFFSTAMQESWHYTSSRDDLTPSTLKNMERFDYLLLGPTPPSGPQTPGSVGIEGRRSCVQHMTVPDRFVRHASDHSMIHADINLGWWHCSPSRALNINVNAGFDIVPPLANGGDTTRLVNPGSIQWFQVTTRETATYSIGTDQPDKVRVDVFLPPDLTHPVSRYNVTPGKGLPPRGVRRSRYKTDIYVLKGPFYIRVAGVSRSTSANYSLAVRKHECATQATACVLKPGEPHPAKLSAQGALNPQDEAWFHYAIKGVLTEGGPQTVNLEAMLFDANAVSADLVGAQDPGGAAPMASALDAAAAKRSWSGSANEGATGFIRFKQNQRGVAARQVSALLDPSIWFAEVTELTCDDETNPEVGSDEIFTTFTIDGVRRRVPASGTRSFDCDDSGQSRDWGVELGLPTIAFTNKVEVRLYEEDDVTGDDASHMRELAPPAPGADIREREPARWSFDGGKYWLSYVSRRSENKPRADP